MLRDWFTEDRQCVGAVGCVLGIGLGEKFRIVGELIPVGIRDQGIGAQIDFLLVGQPVPIGVGHARVRPQGNLLMIGQPVLVLIQGHDSPTKPAKFRTSGKSFRESPVIGSLTPKFEKLADADGPANPPITSTPIA